VKRYKIKPGSIIYQGDTLKIINGMVTTQPVFTRMFPSDFIRKVDNGEIELDTKWLRHDYRVFTSKIGSRHFFGVAAEYAKLPEVDSVLIYDKEDADMVFNITGEKLPDSPAEFTQSENRPLKILGDIKEHNDPVTVKFTEQKQKAPTN
jgi:hypothetical protein